MNRFVLSMKNKRFRYGTFSTVMIVIAIAIFILVNLVAGQMNVTLDLTQSKMYSLSDYSRDFLAELNQDVTIYGLLPSGQEDLMLKSLLEEYAAASPRVHLEFRDPVLYPTFVESYVEPGESISNNSIIVESGDKFRVVAPENMYTQEFDYNTLSNVLTSIDVEPQVSRAIHYVTTGVSPVVYRVTGNGEMDLPAALVSHFESSNYDMRSLDIVLEEIPEDCDMLLITMPTRDWSSDAADRILAYLQNDGNALCLMGYPSTRFPNMDNVLSAYGIRLGDYIVVEGDAQHYYMQTPLYMVPEFAAHDITQPLIDKGFPTLQISQSGYFITGIEETELKKTSTTIEPLFTTSDAAYGKTDPNTQTINQEPGDVEGPFNLAVAITDSYYTDEQHFTKLVVYGGEMIMEESINGLVGGTNWDLLTNSANWLYGETTSIYIPSKSAPSYSQLQMTQGQANVIALVSVIVLPLVILGIGLTVWFRRRHS